MKLGIRYENFVRFSDKCYKLLHVEFNNTSYFFNTNYQIDNKFVLKKTVTSMKEILYYL